MRLPLGLLLHAQQITKDWRLRTPKRSRLRVPLPSLQLLSGWAGGAEGRHIRVVVEGGEAGSDPLRLHHPTDHLQPTTLACTKAFFCES